MAEKKSRGGLGRDLYDIFGDNETVSAKNAAAEKISITSISPRKDQPRKNFDKESLELLADSVSKFGVLQPILVRKDELGGAVLLRLRRVNASDQLTSLGVKVKNGRDLLLRILAFFSQAVNDLLGVFFDIFDV